MDWLVFSSIELVHAFDAQILPLRLQFYRRLVNVTIVDLRAIIDLTFAQKMPFWVAWDLSPCHDLRILVNVFESLLIQISMPEWLVAYVDIGSDDF